MKFGGDSRFLNLLVPREISSSLEWKVIKNFMYPRRNLL